MRLYYYRCETGNFGDDLNPWLWHRLIPELLDTKEETLFIGIGTLLNHRVPHEPCKVVFGTGAGYGERPVLDGRWDFRCVRGPLTAVALGLKANLAITDPAMLLATIDLPTVSRNEGVAFIPHHLSALYADWAMVCRELGIRYIDPGSDVDTVIHEIRCSESIVTEAMHGAILADAFRIPWKAVRCYDHILEFKWQDWCSSLGMTYDPELLPGIWGKDRNASGATRAENNVLRDLTRLRISNANWLPTPRPSRSSRDDVSSLLDRFSRLLRDCKFSFSRTSRFEIAVARLTDALIRMKRAYGYE